MPRAEPNGGPRLEARTIASEGAIYGAMGDGKVGHIDTRDIAVVAVTVLTSEGHEGQIYPLTGPESLSMAEVAARLSTAPGHGEAPGIIAVGGRTSPDWQQHQ